ncbi:MAG: hypothetical protein DI539_28310, partial [Flavobacterium psychrophilum]
MKKIYAFLLAFIMYSAWGQQDGSLTSFTVAANVSQTLPNVFSNYSYDSSTGNYYALSTNGVDPFANFSNNLKRITPSGTTDT